MNTEDMYGFSTDDLDKLRPTLEKALGFGLVPRESSYVSGGDYYSTRVPNGDSFRLQKNYDAWEDEWTTEDYKEIGSLLYVFSPEHSDEMKAMLLRAVPEIKHLERSETTPAGTRRRLKYVNGKEVLCCEAPVPPK